MRVRYREIVETIEFDSFTEMFKFLFKEQGLVFCDGGDESDLRVFCTFLDRNRCRNIYIQYPTDTSEDTSYRKMAEGVRDDCANVDEEELSLLYDLSAFRGEIRTIERD